MNYLQNLHKFLDWFCIYVYISNAYWRPRYKSNEQDTV